MFVYILYFIKLHSNPCWSFALLITICKAINTQVARTTCCNTEMMIITKPLFATDASIIIDQWIDTVVSSRKWTVVFCRRFPWEFVPASHQPRINEYVLAPGYVLNIFISCVLQDGHINLCIGMSKWTSCFIQYVQGTVLVGLLRKARKT